MFDIDMLSTDLCSFSDLTDLLDASEYPEHIENATEDQMHCWLLEQGYTSSDITALLETGMSYCDIVETEEFNGVPFNTGLS